MSELRFCTATCIGTVKRKTKNPPRMSLAIVDHIAQHMKLGHIERIDVDWNDAFWLNVKERKITAKIELIEKEIPNAPQS